MMHGPINIRQAGGFGEAGSRKVFEPERAEGLTAAWRKLHNKGVYHHHHHHHLANMAVGDLLNRP